MSNQLSTQATNPSKTFKYTSIILRTVAAIAFLAAGSSKLIGTQMMLEIFDHIGLGQWLRILTGLVEVTGAIALMIPLTIGLGGLLLTVTMCFAIMTHLYVIGGSPVPAVTLLLITLTISWLHRASITRLYRLYRKSGLSGS